MEQDCNLVVVGECLVGPASLLAGGVEAVEELAGRVGEPWRGADLAAAVAHRQRRPVDLIAAAVRSCGRPPSCVRAASKKA